MRSSQPNRNPGELLFNHLVVNCKTKKPCAAAIRKILDSPGGEDTVKAAIEYGKQRIKSFRIEMQEVQIAIDNLYAKRFSMSDKDYSYEIAQIRQKENYIKQSERNSSPEYASVLTALADALTQFKNEKELNEIIELSKEVYMQQQRPRPQ